ncbi:MAG: hypothetical protein J3R72DRAFT_130941 [Linnemannia gamsii]|nr:MAG: hypothetical protein J3R72DRAFT_130941 [Linnemannia gamsii]
MYVNDNTIRIVSQKCPWTGSKQQAAVGAADRRTGGQAARQSKTGKTHTTRIKKGKGRGKGAGHCIISTHSLCQHSLCNSSFFSLSFLFIGVYVCATGAFSFLLSSSFPSPPLSSYTLHRLIPLSYVILTQKRGEGLGGKLKKGPIRTQASRQKRQMHSKKIYLSRALMASSESSRSCGSCLFVSGAGLAPGTRGAEAAAVIQATERTFQSNRQPEAMRIGECSCCCCSCCCVTSGDEGIRGSVCTVVVVGGWVNQSRR